eukprot:2593744-Pyramimonas_sp.AAC.1
MEMVSPEDETLRMGAADADAGVSLEAATAGCCCCCCRLPPAGALSTPRPIDPAARLNSPTPGSFDRVVLTTAGFSAGVSLVCVAPGRSRSFGSSLALAPSGGPPSLPLSLEAALPEEASAPLRFPLEEALAPLWGLAAARGLAKGSWLNGDRELPPGPCRGEHPQGSVSRVRQHAGSARGTSLRSKQWGKTEKVEAGPRLAAPKGALGGKPNPGGAP